MEILRQKCLHYSITLPDQNAFYLCDMAYTTTTTHTVVYIVAMMSYYYHVYDVCHLVYMTTTHADGCENSVTTNKNKDI